MKIPYKSIQTNSASLMETRISRLLKKGGVKFLREVIFEGCINPKTKMPLRFDFYLPELNTLIEYDGKGFHNSKEVLFRDAIKDAFAKDNGFIFHRVAGFKELAKALATIGINPHPDKIEINPDFELAKKLLYSNTKEFYVYFVQLLSNKGIKTCNQLKDIAPELYSYSNVKYTKKEKDSFISELTKYVK